MRKELILMLFTLLGLSPTKFHHYSNASPNCNEGEGIAVDTWVAIATGHVASVQLGESLLEQNHERTGKKLEVKHNENEK